MKPIFIGGVDRSGTTLLGSLLASLPGTCVTPESLFKTEMPWSAYPSPESYKEALLVNHRFKIWNITDLSSVKASSEALFLQELVCLYAREEPKFWVDHSPNNLEHCCHLKSLFSDAKFIHMVRDGRAVANSIMHLEWGPNTALSAARYWVDKLAYCFAAQVMLSEDVMVVYFEDLVEDPVSTLNQIISFIGEEHRLKCEADIAIADDIINPRTRNQHSRIGTLPDREVASKWKSSMTREEIRDFQYYAGGMLQLLGYPLVEGLGKPSAIHVASDRLRELTRRKLINRRIYASRRFAS